MDESDRAVLTVRVFRDPSNATFRVEADEAPDCESSGFTITDALTNFADAFVDWAIARAHMTLVQERVNDAR